MLYGLTIFECIALGYAISFVLGGTSIVWRKHTGRKMEGDLWNFFIHNAPVGLGIVWFNVAPIFAPIAEGDESLTGEVIDFRTPKEIAIGSGLDRDFTFELKTPHQNKSTAVVP